MSAGLIQLRVPKGVHVTFSVKKYVADKNLTPFPFEDIDGVMRELPNLLLMHAAEADRIMALVDTDPAAALAAMVPDAIEVIERTPIVALTPLAEAWMAHCKGEGSEGLGESGASSPSDKPTARPLKRTSPRTTPKKTQKQ